MGQTSIPQGYSPLLSIYETQKAIGLLKRLFEDRLSGALPPPCSWRPPPA